jgi:hypothetical protein
MKKKNGTIIFFGSASTDDNFPLNKIRENLSSFAKKFCGLTISKETPSKIKIKD